MSSEGIFAHFALYGVLVCREHRCAVYGLDEHLKQHHGNTPILKRRELLALYENFHRLPPAKVVQPAPYSLPIDALGPAQDAFLCRSRNSGGGSGSSNNSDTNSAVCDFISTSRAKMRQHINYQHSVKLTRWSSPATASYEDHAAQLWQPVKVQTFFRERRYVRYFVVQTEDEEEQEQQQQGEQQELGH
jgi:hypothetical protein